MDMGLFNSGDEYTESVATWISSHKFFSIIGRKSRDIRKAVPVVSGKYRSDKIKIRTRIDSRS